MAKNSQDSHPAGDVAAWDEALVIRVGAAARRLRGQRSARWLSERTAELGHQLSPQVIARLDAGKRAGHLELVELLVLAEALEVPPVQLLLPELPAGEVEYLPGRRMSAWDALRKITGEDETLNASAGTAGQFMAVVRELMSLPPRSAAIERELERVRDSTAATMLELTAEEDSRRAELLRDNIRLKHQVTERLLQSRDQLTTLDDLLHKLLRADGREEGS